METLTASPEAASIAAFRQAVPFGHGPTDLADRLCAMGRYQALERAKPLPVDPREDHLVYIADGSAKLVAQFASASASTTDRTPKAAVHRVLAFHFAGDIVSVLGQADGDLRLIALCDLELVTFPAEPFLNVAQDDPVVLRSVLTRSLQALHRSRTKMMQLGHKTARQRIADFLVSMAERLCDCTGGACEYTLPMSRRDIGDCLGLKTGTVSRQFSQFREAGLVETIGRSFVRINDIDALACACGNIQTKKRTLEI